MPCRLALAAAPLAATLSLVACKDTARRMDTRTTREDSTVTTPATAGDVPAAQAPVPPAQSTGPDAGLANPGGINNPAAPASTGNDNPPRQQGSSAPNASNSTPVDR